MTLLLFSVAFLESTQVLADDAPFLNRWLDDQRVTGVMADGREVETNLVTKAEAAAEQFPVSPGELERHACFV